MERKEREASREEALRVLLCGHSSFLVFRYTGIYKISFKQTTTLIALQQRLVSALHASANAELHLRTVQMYLFFWIADNIKHRSTRIARDDITNSL